MDADYTEFSKTFDKFNHKLLTNNSPNGIRTKFLESARSQNFIFQNVISKVIAVISDIPKGSHSWPLLFSLFINDLIAIANEFCYALMYVVVSIVMRRTHFFKKTYFYTGHR